MILVNDVIVLLEFTIRGEHVSFICQLQNFSAIRLAYVGVIFGMAGNRPNVANSKYK